MPRRNSQARAGGPGDKFWLGLCGRPDGLGSQALLANRRSCHSPAFGRDQCYLSLTITEKFGWD